MDITKMGAQKGVKLAGSIFVLVKIAVTFIFLAGVALVMALVGFPWYLSLFVFSFALLLLVLQIRNVKKILSKNIKNPDSEPITFSGEKIKEEQNGSGLLVVLAIIAIIGFVAATGYLLMQKKAVKVTQDNVTQTTKTAGSSQKTQKITTKKTVKQIASSQILDCEKDFDCFVEAQKDGKDAKVKFVSALNPFAATLMQTEFYKNKNEHIYHQTIVPNEYSVDDYIKDFKAKAPADEVAKINAIPREQIEKQFNSMKKWSEQALSAQKDTERSCVYNKPSDLIAFLNKWKTGSFSNKDWDFATICVNRNLLENPDCTLQPASMGATEKPSSLRLSKISIADSVGSMSFSVTNFKESADKVLWKIGNSGIAKISQNTGKSVKITPVSPGKTNLVITDSTVNNCQISIPVTVNGR